MAPGLYHGAEKAGEKMKKNRTISAAGSGSETWKRVLLSSLCMEILMDVAVHQFWIPKADPGDDD